MKTHDPQTIPTTKRNYVVTWTLKYHKSQEYEFCMTWCDATRDFVANRVFNTPGKCYELLAIEAYWNDYTPGSDRAAHHVLCAYTIDSDPPMTKANNVIDTMLGRVNQSIIQYEAEMDTAARNKAQRDKKIMFASMYSMTPEHDPQTIPQTPKAETKSSNLPSGPDCWSNQRIQLCNHEGWFFGDVFVTPFAVTVITAGRKPVSASNLQRTQMESVQWHIVQDLAEGSYWNGAAGAFVLPREAVIRF